MKDKFCDSLFFVHRVDAKPIVLRDGTPVPSFLYTVVLNLWTLLALSKQTLAHVISLVFLLFLHEEYEWGGGGAVIFGEELCAQQVATKNR